jgi:hypothetical protein
LENHHCVCNAKKENQRSDGARYKVGVNSWGGAEDGMRFEEAEEVDSPESVGLISDLPQGRFKY